MGKLYELIKEDIEELNKYREFEVQDFGKSKSFPALLEAEKHRTKVNTLLDAVSLSLRKKLGDDKYDKIMDKYKNARKDIVINPIRYSYEYKMNPILDYETLLDHVENSVSKDVFDAIVTEFDKNANSIHRKCVYTYMRELVWRLSEFAFFVRLLR